MKTEDDTQKPETIAKVEWSEPKVRWVKPELISLSSDENVHGKPYGGLAESDIYHAPS